MVVVGRVADPPRRDQDPAPQSGLCRSSDLGYRRVDVRQYRHDRDPGPPLGAVAAQLGQPAVVGPRPGHGAPRIEVARLAQAGPERSPGDPGHGVGVGEDDLADHPVAVELFVPQTYIPSARDAVSMLGEPLLGELLVDEPADLRCGSLLGQVGLEVLPVFRVDVFAVLLGRELGVAVCGNDDVIVPGAHGRSFRYQARMGSGSKTVLLASGGTAASGSATSATAGPIRLTRVARVPRL